MSTPTCTREKPLPEGVLTAAQLKLGADFGTDQLGEMGIHDLAWLHRNPDAAAREVIDCACSHCGAPLKAMRLFSQLTGCDECREKYLDDERMNACKSRWEEACPRDLRLTDPKYKGDADRGIPPFPTAIYNDLRTSWNFNESLYLYGPSGSAKTRVATLLMKRALLAGKDIGFLWPEELKDAAQSRFDRLKLLRGFAARDILMMDDVLMSGAMDEKITDFLRDLIDLIMRNGNRFVLTSQVGEQDYSQAADKFGKSTTADKERIAAIFRRIRQQCRVVPFATPKAGNGAQTF